MARWTFPGGRTSVHLGHLREFRAFPGHFPHGLGRPYPLNPACWNFLDHHLQSAKLKPVRLVADARRAALAPGWKATPGGYRAVVQIVYLLLFPKGPLQAALRTDSQLFRAVFQALRKIDTDAFIREDRV